MPNTVVYPRLAYVNAITNAQNAVVTFTEDHTFIVNEIVSFRCTKPFGMTEINNQRGQILSITDDTITVDIDTLNYTAFSYALINTVGTTPPTCLPSSSGVILNDSIPQTTINDAQDVRLA
jgi:hypothetical protein